MDDANQGSLIGDISGTSSQPLHLQDDAMVDILMDISVPLPPTILDNDAHYFEGQDDAMADTLIGIEIPSPNIIGCLIMGCKNLAVPISTTPQGHPAELILTWKCQWIQGVHPSGLRLKHPPI